MLRRPPWVASRSQWSPWLLLHAVEACELTVFTVELLDGGAMRPTPLYAYRLPARTMPGSLSLGQHAIFCACDAGEGEGVDEPSQLLILSRAESEEPERGRGAVAGGGAGARPSTAPHAAVLQRLPMPSGVVMFLAPLGECPVAGTTADQPTLSISSSAVAAAPLGVCLVASRTALYRLRMHRRPEHVCRRLLRPWHPRVPRSLGAVLGVGSSSATRDGGLVGVDVPFAAAAASARVAHALLLARSFGLDVDVLLARAAAEALVNVPLHARHARPSAPTTAPDGSLEATSMAAALLSARLATAPTTALHPAAAPTTALHPAAALGTLKLLVEMGWRLEQSAMQVPLPPAPPPDGQGPGHGASSRAWTDTSTRATGTAAARDASSSERSVATKPVAPLLSDVAVRALWSVLERGFTVEDAPPAGRPAGRARTFDRTGHSAPFAPSTPLASPVDTRAPSADADESSTPSLGRRRRDAAASQRRLALIRLCCALHARLLQRGSLPMLTSGTKTAVRADVYAAAAAAEAAAEADGGGAAAAAAPAAPAAAAAAAAPAAAAAAAAHAALVEEAAHAALVAAPAEAARILALCGYWWLVITPALVLPTTALSPTTARRSTTALEPNTALSPSSQPMPSLRARLRWLREAAARGALQLAERRRTPASEWERLLRACMQEDSCGRGYTSDTSSDAADGAPESDELFTLEPLTPAAGAGLLASVATWDALEGDVPNMDDPFGRFPNMDDPNMDDPDGATASDVADACLLLRLALLPPPPLDAACALGAQLEPFVRRWLSAGWPRQPLIAELRGRMLVAAPAVCWLLEHRPALMAKAALGAELLLDCIRVVATVGEEYSRAESSSTGPLAVGSTPSNTPRSDSHGRIIFQQTRRIEARSYAGPRA